MGGGSGWAGIHKGCWQVLALTLSNRRQDLTDPFLIQACGNDVNAINNHNRF